MLMYQSGKVMLIYQSIKALSHWYSTRLRRSPVVIHSPVRQFAPWSGSPNMVAEYYPDNTCLPDLKLGALPKRVLRTTSVSSGFRACKVPLAKHSGAWAWTLPGCWAFSIFFSTARPCVPKDAGAGDIPKSCGMDHPSFVSSL